MSKALVIGGCGYVGSVLVNTLVNESWDVTVMDSMWFGNHLQSHPKLTIIHQDIRDAFGLPNERFDVVFHLANIANDPAALINAALSWETNVLSMRHILEWAIATEVGRFIFSSSGSVYGVSEQERVIETSQLRPISTYNKTKMIAERVALSYANDIEIAILRPATVCGISPRMRFDVTVNLFARQAAIDGKVTVDGGSQIRPNIHVNDLAMAFLHLAEKTTPADIYNAGFENLSIMQIAERVAEISGCQVVATGEVDPRSYRLDSTKLTRTGFFPQHGVDDAITEVIEGLSLGALEDRPEWHSVEWLAKLVRDGRVV
jgi:nucleoside-diphosphate-sugar epimerase